jgi:hypothetical protein
MLLMEKSSFTTSTTMFKEIQEQEEARPPEAEEQPIALGSSRAFASSPMIIAPSLVLPLSPLVERLRPRFRAAIALEKPAKTIQWNVVGYDQDSLNSFLRAFE